MTATPQKLRTPAEEELLGRLDGIEASGGRLGPLKAEASRRFADAGLPHRRVEAYKYTDLKARLRDVPPLGTRPSLDAARAALAVAPGWGAAERLRIALVDGFVVPEASDLDRLPAGITCKTLADVLAGDDPVLTRIGSLAGPAADPMIDLNTAFLSDGLVIDIAEGAQIAPSIEIVHAVSGTEPVACHPRHFMSVGKGARVRVIESYCGPAGSAYQVNSVIELAIGADADVAWIRSQQDGEKALNLATLALSMAEGATFRHSGFVFGSDLSRAQMFLAFEGEGAEADLAGITLAHGRQHADTTLVVDHKVPHCISREVFKTVLDDEARGIFQGRIVVRPDAQHTDGRMMSRALLLSEGGEAIAKPELEIYADDVQCAHGAVSGSIDEDALFYLMARGIPRPEAETMLVAAFLGEVIDRIENEAIAEVLRARVSDWLIERRRGK